MKFAAFLLSVAMLSVAAQGQESAAPQPINVELSSYAFAPATLELKAGGSYTLHFINTSTKSHNFKAPEFFQAVAVAAGDRSKVDDGAVEVEAGQSVDVTLTAQMPGTYKTECSHFLHASFGMTGQAVIRP